MFDESKAGLADSLLTLPQSEDEMTVHHFFYHVGRAVNRDRDSAEVYPISLTEATLRAEAFNSEAPSPSSCG